MEDRGYSKSQFVKSRPLQSQQQAKYQRINEKAHQSAPIYSIISCMQNWRPGRKDMRGAEIKKGGNYHLTFKDQIKLVEGGNEFEDTFTVLNLPSDEEDEDRNYRYARVTQRYNERRESIIYSHFEKRGPATDNQAENDSAGINSSVPSQSPVNMPDQQYQEEPDVAEKQPEENQDGESELYTEDQNKKKVERQPIAEVIIVESYKEYNALEEINTTSQNCCLLF